MVIPYLRSHEWPLAAVTWGCGRRHRRSHIQGMVTSFWSVRGSLQGAGSGKSQWECLRQAAMWLWPGAAPDLPLHSHPHAGHPGLVSTTLPFLLFWFRGENSRLARVFIQVPWPLPQSCRSGPLCASLTPRTAGKTGSAVESSRVSLLAGVSQAVALSWSRETRADLWAWVRRTP